MIAYLISHPKDYTFASMKVSINDAIIVHQPAFALAFEGEALNFYKVPSYPQNIDVCIEYLTQNWYRDEQGRDLFLDGGISIPEAYSVGIFNNIAAVCREYYALKYWAEIYEYIYISINEDHEFKKIAESFGEKIRFYNPGHSEISALKSLNLRDLKTDLRPISTFARLVQTPFIWMLKNKIMVVRDWTLEECVQKNNKWIGINFKLPWKAAYQKYPSKELINMAEKRVPDSLNDSMSWNTINLTVSRFGMKFDQALCEQISRNMIERYVKYRPFFVIEIAKYYDLLKKYNPSELIVTSEYLESYKIAQMVARELNVVKSLLVDGYPVIPYSNLIGMERFGPYGFDRIYAAGKQHYISLKKQRFKSTEIIQVKPPILNKKISQNKKIYDVLIMTLIPCEYSIFGCNGSRASNLVDMIDAAREYGFKKIAVKIKHFSEKKLVLDYLQLGNYLDGIDVLEGHLHEHLSKTKIVIGGISSAIGEASNHQIPYYIYEPKSNGYSLQKLSSSEIFSANRVARNKHELIELLMLPEGSIFANRDLLFSAKAEPRPWSWEETRELFSDWCAIWPEISGIKKLLSWRGYSLWWSSELAHKDTAVNYLWYVELHSRLKGFQDSPFIKRSHNWVVLRILSCFTKEFLKWGLLKIISPKFYRSSVPENSIFFSSLEYNLIQTEEGFCDRNYEQAPRDDRLFDKNSVYLLKLNLRPKDFLLPWLIRKKLNYYKKELGRQVYPIDSFIGLRDIFLIHLNILVTYYKFIFFTKKLNKKQLKIGNANFYDIFFLQMQYSFAYEFSYGLMHALMYENFSRRIDNKKIFVTYGEVLAPMRATYYFSKQASLKNYWVSIQHALINRNKLGFYHREIEFDDKSKWVSPSPDYYLIHGSQYHKILSEYYPSAKIKIIGCLKFDRIYRYLNQNLAPTKGNNKNKMLLLCPSIGDEELIIKFLSNTKFPLGWRCVISKHPVAKWSKIKKYLEIYGLLDVVYIDSKRKTNELLRDASLVVTTYSSIGLEAIFYGAPSIRVVDSQKPPLVEQQDDIPSALNSSDLVDYMEKISRNEFSIENSFFYKNVIDRFFYKFDGNSSKRFWSAIEEIVITSEIVHTK